MGLLYSDLQVMGSLYVFGDFLPALHFCAGTVSLSSPFFHFLESRYAAVAQVFHSSGPCCR